jgi:hypothetical protein
MIPAKKYSCQSDGHSDGKFSMVCRLGKFPFKGRSIIL